MAHQLKHSLDSTALQYSSIIYTVSCHGTRRKHRTYIGKAVMLNSSFTQVLLVTEKKWCVLVIASQFKYVNVFQICKWFSVYDFWQEEAHKGLV